MKLLARPRYPNQPDYRNMDEDTPLVIFDETIFKDDFFLNNHLNIVFICSANIAQKEIWRTILKELIEGKRTLFKWVVSYHSKVRGALKDIFGGYKIVPKDDSSNEKPLLREEERKTENGYDQEEYEVTCLDGSKYFFVKQVVIGNDDHYTGSKVIIQMATDAFLPF